ncbi:hypothetical protein [Vibrio sp. TRT 17S01]|uniref:hypothetical protein n=1 Tax=Vibrio sp. TRT 17S01 TaxID=3418505 RepID=UPI003CE6EE11
MNDFFKQARGKRKKHQQQEKPINLQLQADCQELDSTFEATLTGRRLEKELKTKRRQIEQLKQSHQEREQKYFK